MLTIQDTILEALIAENICADSWHAEIVLICKISKLQHGISEMTSPEATVLWNFLPSLLFTFLTGVFGALSVHQSRTLVSEILRSIPKITSL
jgi:hypothetical protein